MTEANELLGADTAMGSDLLEGLRTLSLNQKVRFNLYGRVVLPVDGFVFWVRANLLSQPALTGLLSTEQLAAVEEAEDKQPFFEVAGSLHYAADVRQEEAENYAANRVVFTTEADVQRLNQIAPGTMWIGEFEGLRFGFSNVSTRYRQADLWHYSGFAIYPDQFPNVIDSVTQFSAAQVVSNSLPAWLAIVGYAPPWAFWGPLPALFPSFLVPNNQRPPFATVHVHPDGTRGLASAPTIDPITSSHTQLCADNVRITLWGVRNDQALDFVDAVNQYSLDTAAIGIMNVPVVRDEKRTQAELGVLAQKKVLDFEVSYLQHRMNEVAKKVIKSSIPNFYVNNVPA